MWPWVHARQLPPADWLPVTVGSVEDRTRGTAAKLSGFDYGHAVFEPFRAPRSGDFSTTRVYGFRLLTARPNAVTLARFDGGTPALIEGTLGRGRVLGLGDDAGPIVERPGAQARLPALRPPDRAAGLRLP